LVWCGLKEAENEPNMTLVSDQSLSLAENLRIQKRAFWAGFQTENNLFKNPSTGELIRRSSKDFRISGAFHPL